MFQMGATGVYKNNWKFENICEIQKQWRREITTKP
jgi:hypothetical protein